MSSLEALATVLLRFPAAYLVVTALGLLGTQIPVVISYFLDPPEDGEVRGAILSHGYYLATIGAAEIAAIAAGVVVFILARELSGVFVRGKERDARIGSATSEDLIRGGMFLIGLYFSISVLPRALIQTAMAIYTYWGQSAYSRELHMLLSWERIVPDWITGLAAIYLVVHSMKAMRRSVQ